ncbi:MAG TPA: hypothetical protein HPP80_06150 [Rhodospirillaceae bacterium]|nr:hypothetical protein [Rhodospirillaceae bacterium]
MKAHIFVFALAGLTALSACGGSPVTSGSPRVDGSAPSFTQFSDIPIPAKASMNFDQSLLLGHGEEWVGRLVYTTRSGPEVIYDLYQSDMPSFGWQEITSIRAAISVQTWQRGDRIATVQIHETTLGAEAIITVAPVKGAGSGSSSVYSSPSTSRPSSPSRPSSR